MMSSLPDWRKHAILAILTLSLALSYVDRFLLAILVQPIKSTLHLLDWQIGLLTGFAFSAFYALAGLPLARIADRGFRREVIAGSIFAWSLVTAATGAVNNFVQLAIARFAIGAGEAGIFPTSQAILAEVYPPERRTIVIAIFASGGSIGLLGAFWLGAAMEAKFGWRTSFLLAALPGAVLAPAAWLLLKREKRNVNALQASTLAGDVRSLWRNPHFRHLPFAQSGVVILLFGQTQWLPAYFERSFALSRAEIGPRLGVILAITITIGTIAGGILANSGKFSEKWPIQLSIVSLILAVPSILMLHSAPNAAAAFAAVACMSFFCSVPTGPIAAHLQSVIAPDQRVTAAAWAMMIAALLGNGFGPFAIGAISDVLANLFGAGSLGAALAIVTLAAAVWSLFHMVQIARLMAKQCET